MNKSEREMVLMDNHHRPSGRSKSPGKKPQRRTSSSSSQKREFITLPAIKSSKSTSAKKPALKTSKTSGEALPASAKSAKPKTKSKAGKTVRPVKSKAKTKRQRPPENRVTEPEDFLPEYHSQTNGLRELLSTIDPNDISYHSPAGTFFEPSPYETDMHIPHSAPGLPGSPDLPIGPTRWGLYISTALGGLAMLFVSALVFSHISSPTGINWAKVQLKTGETYQWMVAGLSNETGSNDPASRRTKTDLSELLDDIADANGTVIATASRISTTAASPKPSSLKTPTAGDIFMSAEDLENQIKAFESTSLRARKVRPAPPPKVKKTVRIAQQKPSEYEQLVVIPAANIDPDMENQIFKRARSYLKQRDISSARMILQYAATLGSGISAMALAETFDPNLAEKINLRGVSSSASDARKWYYMAARLGINEANARLTALK